MRITTQMLANSAAQSGIPLQSISLLNIMDNEESSFDLLSAANSNKGMSSSAILNKDNDTKQKELAERLKTYASKLADTGENSVIAKAEESGSTSDVVSDISKMLDEYNATLKQLQKSGDTMSSFYAKYMKQISEDSKEALNDIGITQEKDGTLSIDKKILQSVNLATLKKVVAGESGFASKISFISEHIYDNASNNLASASDPYTSNGLSYLNSFEANKYNFFG